MCPNVSYDGDLHNYRRHIIMCSIAQKIYIIICVLYVVSISYQRCFQANYMGVQNAAIIKDVALNIYVLQKYIYVYIQGVKECRYKKKIYPQQSIWNISEEDNSRKKKKNPKNGGVTNGIGALVTTIGLSVCAHCLLHILFFFFFSEMYKKK